MSNVLQLLRNEIYLTFLLSILLFVSIDISYNNHIVLGQEDSKDGNGGGGEEAETEDNEDNEGGGGGEEAEDVEDISIDELFGDNNDDNIEEEKEEEDDVPFILPFKAVPFP